MERDKGKQSRKEPLREQWIELRTATDRIEGLILIPKATQTRRIADLLLQADRGHCGMLHIAQATVYDLKTNEKKFYKPSLAVNRALVIYAAPLTANETLPKGVFEPSLAGLSSN